MRYYRIVITDPKTGKVITPPGFNADLLGGASYTSFVNGQTLPGAWNVLLDIPVIGQATPQGSGLLQIQGVSRQEISQANDLTGKNISVFAGMQKGLPLANPAQAGLIAQGYIFQAFGNWIETDQTLDLVINPGVASSSQAGGTGTLQAPKNIVLNWKAGTKLADALASTLKTAFPNFKQSININSSIVRQNDEIGYFPTLELLSQYVRQVSIDVVRTAKYPGVSIILQPDDSLSVFDRTSSSSVSKLVVFQDLIGQPTWIEAPNIQIKTVMRADLGVGGKIKLPPTVTTNTQQASSSLLNQQASFLGEFTVISARHVGAYRQPSADAWVTVFEASPDVIIGAGEDFGGGG